MRSGLIGFAVLLLVIGGFLYFFPTQTAQAQTTTVGPTSDTRTSSATFSVPRGWTYAILVAGLLMLLLGLVLPGTRVVVPEVVVVPTRSTTRSTMHREYDDGRKVVHKEREE